MKPHVKAQLAYFELLRTNGLLEEKLLGRLPDNVDKAARVVAAGTVSGVKIDKEKGTVAVTAEEQEEVDREIDAYLFHYKLAQRREAMAKVALFPREFIKGQRYRIKSGTFENHVAEIKGQDRDIFGCTWLENFGHKTCERHVFRCQRDNLPMDGRTFYVELEDKTSALIHETEIGEMVQ